MSAVIVGASTDPRKIGGRPIQHCLELGYEGRLYPVNPKARVVQGLRAYSSVEELPETPDCAIIAVPVAAVHDAVRSCVAKEIPLAVILSAGFAEHSEEGQALQGDILETARRGGLRLIGPNCMGGLSFETKFSATFTSQNLHDDRSWAKLGSISVASQSGFVGSQLLTQFREGGIGLAKWLAVGNQCDIDIADCVRHYADDDITKVIVIYLEGMSASAKLAEALEIARRRRKPVVAIKAGRSDVGSAAIASHTASLVGDYEIYQSFFKTHGAYLAHSLDEVVTVAAALDSGLLPKNENLAIVSLSGGMGVLAADAASESGFSLPALNAQAQADIAQLQPMATTRNPLDMNNLRHFPDALRAVLDDACYGAILCSVGQMGFISKSMNELHAAIARMREDHPDKYIAVVANCSPETRDKFQSLDCFVSDDQNKAISAMAAARYIAGSFEKRAPVIASAELTSLKIDGQNLAGELAAKRMIAGAGIPITQDYLACSAEDAIAFARKIGRRIVLKIASPDIAHKSDLGCVRVGIEPDDDVGRIYSELMDHAKLIVPKARLQGVIVSPMIHDGIEVILGAKRDPVFGAVVMFGLGGIFVEILRDKALRIAPFGPEEALQMITETKAYEILKGARGGPKRDIPALAEALSRLSLFAHANTDTIASVEINPLMVLVGGGGVIAVDALIL